jgi:dephospho-CoA kinase
MTSALKVGITGGIGSGKSTVCKIFEILGIPIYYADESAKKLMQDNPELRNAIQKTFGAESYLEDGSLNRAYLAKLVFGDQEKLKELNGLVHPAVAKDGLRWHEEQKKVHYTLKEAALLYESGSYKDLDLMIAVYAPQSIRLQRVMQRDGADRQAVLSRMQRQWPEAEKVARADFVILNDGKHLLTPQILEIHKALLRVTGKARLPAGQG